MINEKIARLEEISIPNGAAPASRGFGMNTNRSANRHIGQAYKRK